MNKMRMGSKVSVAALALVIAGCSGMHRAEKQADSAMPMRKAPVIGEQPGSQGPVGDYSRRGYGNLADREPMRRDTVADTTVSTSASPRQEVSKSAPVMRKQHKERRRAHVAKNRVGAKSTRSRAVVKKTAVSPEAALLARTVALNELHHVNQREMALARLAKEKGESAHVMNLADRVLADHERLERRVQAVAEKEGITLRTYQPATYEVAAMETIEDFDGDRFDMVYLQSMRVNHARTAANLKRTRGGIADRDVKALIGEALPSLDRHNRLSRQAGMQLGRR